jgi:DMSO/TMAO reductase YedYZ molybdopterin-dependent catalytic subunit
VRRRGFITASVATAGAAVAAGVAGEILSEKRFPSAATRATTPNASAPSFTLPRVTGPVVPKGAELDIPGLSTFYTPTSQFYRVDTALTIPEIAVRSWKLKIHGMVDNPMTMDFGELIRRPMVEHDITLCCVADSIGDHLTGNARWEGTLLADVLREAGVQSGAQQIVMTDVNGMTIGVSLDAVMDGRAALLAIGQNGQVLQPEHGFPVRVVVPGLYGYVSATKWVVDMYLTTYGADKVYYTQRGWAAEAPIKTESRIDIPKGGARLPTGKNVIAGVAWAEHKGIAAVEVGIDGTFFDANLAVQDTIDTWRQWYYVWDATPGSHQIKVRATDQTGYTQTSVNQPVFPNGATGWDSVGVVITLARAERREQVAERVERVRADHRIAERPRRGHAAHLGPVSLAGGARVRPHDPVRQPGQPRHLRADKRRVARLPPVGDNQHHRAARLGAVRLVELSQAGADRGTRRPVGCRLPGQGEHGLRGGGGQFTGQPGQPRREREHLGTGARRAVHQLQHRSRVRLHRPGDVA